MSELSDLAAIRRYIEASAARLDPHSRYVRELAAIAADSSSVQDFEDRLDAGCRGLRHSGRDVFEQMTLEEKILANLITPETSLFRFSEGEMEAIDRHLLPHLGDRKAEILIVPCSHGEEAFTIASYFLKVGIEFGIRAFDVQPALIEEARTGRLTFGYPIEYLASPGYVSRPVLDRITFEVGDAFALPLDGERFDLILCRNFVGYFVEAVAFELIDALRRRTAPGGVLFLDGFCIGKHPSIAQRLEASGATKIYDRPAFVMQGPA
jgi:chemotaxis methyl-accepting protein methylase